ncbi:proteoglycan Cow isoform X1 [Odontomachus brunneus]|uniref:proteoglycan Cow isoform X1 n=2 Tax=Odontomachus brunneus TaxID=486640 RepID=UPI0013F29827|nr:proteoglycan Cow isoform X1 [Odontomachus brunneus]
MRFSWVFAATVLLVLATGARCKRKFDGDFEFAEEDDTRIMKVGDKKRWIHDPNSELCRPLNCKKKELCLLEDTFTAVCVSKKELHKSGDIVIPKSRAVQQRRMRTETSVDPDDDDAFFDSEDDDEDQDESKCQECPVVKPTFLCGSDNRTYSSPCRLEYHNCIHHTSVHIACKGFCPCKVADLRTYTKKMQMQRKKTLMGKMGGRSHDITLTPRDFNYDNHHYQYLKYTKRGKALINANRYDDKHLMSNEVMDKTQSPLKAMYNVQLPSRNTDCPSSSKPAMANRLLDWFSVVMADSKHRRQHPKPKGHFPISCQSEVRWMFGHLDSDSDGRLSLSELYGLEHDQNEPCLKPFLDACDTDSDIFVSGPEWCGCFSKAERPCAAVRRRSSSDSAPACDSRGYYRSTQCHRGLGLCWCVDPHGVEFAGTRTRGTKPDCDTIVNKISSGGLKTNSVDLDDDEDGGTDSAQDLEGSADQPLDF